MSDGNRPQGEQRDGAATYIDGQHHDADQSMPALDEKQNVLDILKTLPDEFEKPIRRWETFRSKFTKEAVTELVTKKKWRGKITNSSTTNFLTVKSLKNRRKALQERGFIINDRTPLNKNHKEHWLKLIEEAEVNAEEEDDEDDEDDEDEEDDEDDEEDGDEENDEGGQASKNNHAFIDLSKEIIELEPYYRLAWRSLDWAKSRQSFESYEYGKKHKMCNQQERPDLILEVGYFSSNSGLFTKRVIICEIDGEDKTSAKKKSSAKKSSADNDNADDDDAEAAAEAARKPKDDPIKLALKLMSSTFAQNALQPQTYHIRANYLWYFDRLIDKSLLSTTSVELPEFADIIRLYGKDTNSEDHTTLHRAIHFIHHMFTAHVKIAFLIHMQVVHNVDMRSMDQPNPRMCNHCFFVNFEASCMPEQLTWQDRMPEGTRIWLENKQMLHSRVQIKHFDYYEEDDDVVQAPQWVAAPVLDASSHRSAMNEWHADVDSARLPLFPYEKQVCVPVICATIQRVDMKKLTDLVLKAAQKALALYQDAKKCIERETKLRVDNEEYSVKIRRRQFPDRCFLTREQQYDRKEWWNKADVPLRFRREELDKDLLDFAWGYEKPQLQRKTFQEKIDDYANSQAQTWQKWDQLDVRMHFFDIAMMEDPSWKMIESIETTRINVRHGRSTWYV